MNRNQFLENLFGKILSPFEWFLQRTAAGGIVLMGATVLTLVWANSTMGDSLHHLWELPVRVTLGSRQLDLTVHEWINEGLMTLFFLVVGLELKREILVGELSSLRDAALPVVAALGGMIVPGLIYYVINPEGPQARGWGIPMATDIAFSIGILVLLARRIPRSLIVFLTALAIADDLGAVLVIALFYTQDLSLQFIGAAVGILALLLVLNRGGILHPLPYAVLGLMLWGALLHSGIHATLAGVLLAFAIPARPALTTLKFERHMIELQQSLLSKAGQDCEHALQCPIMATFAENLEKAARVAQSPQQRMEHALSPWVTFLVVPVFALSNAGIDFSSIELGETLMRPVALGVTLGLFFGKFTGIAAFCWVAERLGLARLPEGVRWPHLLGVAWLAGIGFTMSLFVNQLAFEDQVLLEEARLGILLGSAISGIVGFLWLFLLSNRSPS